MSLIGFILSFVRKQLWTFIALFVVSLIWSFDLLFWPFFLRKIFDVLTQYEVDRLPAWSDLKMIVVQGGIALLFVELMFRLKDFLNAKAYPNLEANIRMAMFDHIQNHSPKYFHEHFAGSLSNKIGDMVSTCSSIVRVTLSTFIPGFVSFMLAVAVFFNMNLYLALIVAGWIILNFVLSWVFTLKCAHYSYLHGEARNSLIGKIVDSITNNLIVNLFFRFPFEKKYIGAHQQEEQKANHRSQIYSAKMFSFTSLIFITEFTLLIWFFMRQWTYGKISTGEVAQLFNTIRNMNVVIWVIISQLPYFFQSFGIAKQAFSTMQDPKDIVDPPIAKKLVISQGEITFEHVSFSYGKKHIFQNLNLCIGAGEKVGLVGHSGAGKSTFVNLLLRFFSPEKGRILIDGQDIAFARLESLRNNIALIPQEPILFHRTLEENIRYGKIDASLEDVMEAARLAHCEEFIRRCPDGYNTLVGERGGKLSGGEKQRIVIARAMLLQAPILVLDEATSALDSLSEQYIQESLEKLMTNRTTIVIAHRLSTLSKMDRILVFDRGKIIEQGSHKELLDKNGHYAHMWHMQAGGFIDPSSL